MQVTNSADVPRNKKARNRNKERQRSTNADTYPFAKSGGTAGPGCQTPGKVWLTVLCSGLDILRTTVYGICRTVLLKELYRSMGIASPIDSIAFAIWTSLFGERRVEREVYGAGDIVTCHHPEGSP
jgi:hypothetical protein